MPKPTEQPEVVIVAPNSYSSVDLDYIRRQKSKTHSIPPLGPLCIATSLQEAGIPTAMLDAERDLLTDAETIDRISKMLPEGGYAGWTSWIITMDKTAAMISALKEKRPDIRHVVGGPHMSAVPVRTMQKFPDIEYGVVGEGEKAIIEIIKHWGDNKRLSQLPGILVRDGDKLHFKTDTRRGYTRDAKNRYVLMNQGLEIDVAEVQGTLDKSTSKIPVIWPMHADRIEDVNLLPIPNYKMLGDLSSYHLSEFTPPAGETQMSVISSRGCSFACSFCDQEVSGHTIRSLTPERSIEHMQYIKKLGIDYLYFTDDLRLIDLSYEEENARRILETGDLKGITWEAITRANLAARAGRKLVNYSGRSMNLLDLMSEAGCRQLHIAPETGNEELRYQALFKRITNQEIIDSVRVSSQAGISVKTLNMVGLPGETPKHTLETLEFIRDLGYEGAAYGMFAICTPLPTTPLALMIESGQLKWTGDLDDWEKMNLGGAAGIFTSDIHGNEVDYTPEHILLAARGKHKLGKMVTEREIRAGETIEQKIAVVRKMVDEHNQSRPKQFVV